MTSPGSLQLPGIARAFRLYPDGPVEDTPADTFGILGFN